jgi:hypothetical protein
MCGFVRVCQCKSLILLAQTRSIPTRPPHRLMSASTTSPGQVLANSSNCSTCRSAQTIPEAAYVTGLTERMINHENMPSFETAARSLKVEPIIAPVHNDVEIETAIIALGREP